MLLFLDSTVIAHAGDGNFHTVILFDPTKEEERKEAERLNNFMVHAALLLEGIDNTLLLIHVAC
jgi:D-lactate dehydrogenase (cytochrome)